MGLDLLHLAPNSTDAQVFKQFESSLQGNNSTTNATNGGKFSLLFIFYQSWDCGVWIFIELFTLCCCYRPKGALAVPAVVG